VFKKFCRQHITSNPEICRFGMTETEYIGRVINSERWKFSDDKSDEALNFKIPQRLGEYNNFIGHYEYFHSQMSHLSEIHGYSKTFWHTRRRTACCFLRVQEEITDSSIILNKWAAPMHLQIGFFDDGIDSNLFSVCTIKISSCNIEQLR